MMNMPPNAPLNDRARGWLRHLHTKATTPDDWSSSGEPHEWWDAKTYAPVTSFHRFDIEMSSWALLMMADATPAWREVYTETLNGLLERHQTWRAGFDWSTQIGDDPERGRYPQDWLEHYIPRELWGKYNMPGWTGNGLPPWGIQRDPIAADGNLFFKGWLNFVLGAYEYVSGDQKWRRPFTLTGMDDETFEWTHDGINERLVEQWTARPEGVHCENTKIWPLCLSGAGLGLQMYDTLRGTNGHWVYDRWLSIVREKYSKISDGGHVEWMALYYDPIEGFVQRAMPAGYLTTSLYVLPQDRSFSESLYRSAIEALRWNDPHYEISWSGDPRPLCMGLILAREFGDSVTTERLREYGERNFEPRFFGADGADFGWWFGFGERYPRGQLSSVLAMSEVGAPGAWTRTFTAPNLRKFDQPTVEGVDFPSVGLSTAEYHEGRGVLSLATYAATPADRGTPTSFRVTGLPDAASTRVVLDGVDFHRWEAIAHDALRLDLDVDAHELEVHVAPR